MDIGAILVLAVLGLVFGSFIGAVSWRLPRSVGVSSGRSKCVHCKKKISWYDNIPVFSYILLRGKCRNCKEEISPRYPLIEVSSMVGFVFIWLFLPNIKENVQFLGALPDPLALIYLLTVFLTLVAIFVIDLEHRVILDSLVFILFVGTLVMFLIGNYQDIYLNLFSGFLASLLLLFIHLITNGKGMGLGDVKFALFGGLFLGFPGFLIWLFLSFVLGAIVGILLILFKRAEFGRHIAFGPFLCVALVIEAVFGKLIYKLLFF